MPHEFTDTDDLSGARFRGVSLAGGRGGVFGPIVAVVILSLLRTDMTFLNVNTNLATVAQGLILVGVVMVGSLLQLRKREP